MNEWMMKISKKNVKKLIVTALEAMDDFEKRQASLSYKKDDPGSLLESSFLLFLKHHFQYL